jgi:hypothetical protein
MRGLYAEGDSGEQGGRTGAKGRGSGRNSWRRQRRAEVAALLRKPSPEQTETSCPITAPIHSDAGGVRSGQLG